MGTSALQRPLEVRSKTMLFLAKYVDPTQNEAKTRAIAGQAVIQVSLRL